MIDLDFCTKNSMVGSYHFGCLEKFIDELNSKKINGAIVECGVWKGGVSMWMMTVQKRYSTDTDFYLYDTFDGMTEPQLGGESKDGGRAQKHFKHYTNIEPSRWDNWDDGKKWCYASLELVKKNIKLAEYNEENIHYVIGDVAETLKREENIPNEIAILRLDTDWYDSTKVELEILFPKLVVGGYLILDDYWAWDGAKIAFNEFSEKNNEKLLEYEVGRIYDSWTELSSEGPRGNPRVPLVLKKISN